MISALCVGSALGSVWPHHHGTVGLIPSGTIVSRAECAPFVESHGATYAPVYQYKYLPPPIRAETPVIIRGAGTESSFLNLTLKMLAYLSYVFGMLIL